MLVCYRKHCHYSDRKICYNPATSTFLLVVGLDLKSSHTQGMLLHIESTWGYTHHKQVEVVYYYKEKEW
jgi:hypothetical protein